MGFKMTFDLNNEGKVLTSSNQAPATEKSQIPPSSKTNTVCGRVFTRKNLIKSFAVISIAALAATVINHNNQYSRMSESLNSLSRDLHKTNPFCPEIHKNSYVNVITTRFNEINENIKKLRDMGFDFGLDPHELASLESNSYKSPLCDRPFEFFGEQSRAFSVGTDSQCLDGYLQIPVEINNDLNAPLTEKEVEYKIKAIKKQIGRGLFSEYGYSLKLSTYENTISGSVVHKISGVICRKTPYSMFRQAAQLPMHIGQYLFKTVQ